MMNRGIIILLIISGTFFLMFPYASAQSTSDETGLIRYVYADPLPQWASFDSGVVDRAMKAWEDANPNLMLQQVDSLDKADLHIVWARDGSDLANIMESQFGESAPSSVNGITLPPKATGLSYTTIIATLGNEGNCFNVWEPNSQNTLARIVEHETGHFLGFDHTPDPYAIMHEGAPQQYYKITRSFEIPSNSEGVGVRIWCALGDTTKLPVTFNYQISTAQTTSYDFSFYHVSRVGDETTNSPPPVQYQEGGCTGGGIGNVAGTCIVSTDSILSVKLYSSSSLNDLEINLWLQPSTYLTELEGANAPDSSVAHSSQLFNLPANTAGTQKAVSEVLGMTDFPSQYTDTGVKGMLVKNSMMWPDSVIVYVKQSERSGVLNLDFARSDIDSKVGVSSGTLALLSDDSKVTWTERDNSTDRYFVIDFNGPIDQIIITKPNAQSQQSSPLSSIQASYSIPAWIKNNAKWWADGTIDDSTFASGIQYLVKQGIIQVPTTQAGSTTSQQIPSWVKNNAKWWAEGQVSDDEFIKAIQYLISNGIIQVSS